MKRLALALPLLLALGCTGHLLGGTVPPPGAYNGVPPFSETQTCTAGTCSRSAPASTAEGMELGMVQGFRLMVCAPAGQTLSGAGTMQAWLCDAAKGVCARNPDLDKSVTASSVQCQVFPDFTVGVVPWTDKSVVFAANGVTVSSGTPLTVYLDAGGPK